MFLLNSTFTASLLVLAGVTYPGWLSGSGLVMPDLYLYIEGTISTIGRTPIHEYYSSIHLPENIMYVPRIA